ncbi:MAG: O-antigen ligase family protein [Pseudomonadota bacterium]
MSTITHGRRMGANRPRVSRQRQATPVHALIWDHKTNAIGLIFLVIGFEFVQQIPSIAVYILLSALALRSPEWSIRALTAGIFATLLTGGITQEFIPLELREVRVGTSDTGKLVGRYMLLVACLVQFLTGKPARNRLSFWPAFVAFTVVVVLNSIVVSYEPLVSLFKAGTLGLGTFILLRAAMLFRGSRFMEDWFSVFIGASVLASLPLVLLPEGFLVNGAGFQGLYNHPQVFGVLCGIFAAALFQRAINGRNRQVANLTVLTVTLICLVLSQARTGMLAFLVGTLVATFASMFAKDAKKGAAIPFALLGCIALLLALSLPQTYDVIGGFVSKRNYDAYTLTTLWSSSRGRLVEEALAGFVQHPFLGVGFGLPSDPNLLEIKYDPFLGLPIGASVEKGLIFTAVLEELGLLGGFVSGLFLLSIIGTALTHAKPEGIALVFAAIASNLGESTLTSFGGLGGFVWLAIAVGLSMTRRDA